MNSTEFHLSNEPQLFVDNFIIECTQGLTRRWHKPVRFGDRPLISRDRPWEKTLYFTYSTHTVLKDPDDGKIKCWYEDLGPITGKGHPLRTRLLYAESDDGIVFRKPELDVCTIDGKPTNIVMGFIENDKASLWNPWARDGVHCNGILIDPDPLSPEEKFKTIFTRYKIGKEPKNNDDLYDAVKVGHSIECAHSRDGIHWITYDSKPLIGGSSSMLDDVSCLHYDSHAEFFVQNTRHYKMYDVSLPPLTPRVSQWFAPYYPLRPDLMNKRRVFQSRSKDFLTWGDLIPVSVPDDETDNLDEAHYGMQQFRIGDIHFATLGILKYVDNEMEVRLL